MRISGVDPDLLFSTADARSVCIAFLALSEGSGIVINQEWQTSTMEWCMAYVANFVRNEVAAGPLVQNTSNSERQLAAHFDAVDVVTAAHAAGEPGGQVEEGIVRFAGGLADDAGALAMLSEKRCCL